ncbi:MAG: hypothetical protein SV862_00110 [Pseudomonadota bacterium]|nr:hypothetical protein [Pseudomonadota bacterium]
MTNSNPMPRWGQWAAGSALLAVALVAGGTGLALNVSHGLAGGWAPATVYGLADIGKMLIPFVCGFIGWTMHRKLVAAACVATSIWCAVNAWQAVNEGKQSAAVQQQTAWTASQTDAGRIRAELASITETGTAATLRAAAGQATARADDEAKNGGCRKRCLDARAEAAALTERAGQAERRAELEGKLETVTAKAEASGGPAASEGGSGIVDALLFLLLIEGLVWLTLPAAELLRAASAARETAPAPEPAPVAEPVAEAVPAPKAEAAKRGTAAYYRARLATEHPEIAARIAGGELSVYAASIEAGLRKAKPVSRWTKIDAYSTPSKGKAKRRAKAQLAAAND